MGQDYGSLEFSCDASEHEAEAKFNSTVMDQNKIMSIHDLPESFASWSDEADPPTLSPPQDHTLQIQPGSGTPQPDQNAKMPCSPRSTPEQTEIVKSFRPLTDETTAEILPATLKKHGIDSDFEQVSLFIQYEDQERCLHSNEKPLALFRQLAQEGKEPAFVIRKKFKFEDASTEIIIQNEHSHDIDDVFSASINAGEDWTKTESLLEPRRRRALMAQLSARECFSW